ncbi:aminotransferase class IV [soil metagenome]
MQISDRALLYGCGVFTTIRIVDRFPFRWNEHWLRLLVHADKIGLVGVPSEQVIRRTIQPLIKGFLAGRVRITLLDHRPSALWESTEKIPNQDFYILVGKVAALPTSFHLSISPYPTQSGSPLAGIKSCNYLEPLMSLDEAKGRGFHEAIRVNECGFVTSACLANVFWLKRGELFTPSLATGCLAGTTREFILENINCREVEAPIDVLDGADAIFLTSAGIGVVHVAAFDERRFERIDHPIMHLLPY